MSSLISVLTVWRKCRRRKGRTQVEGNLEGRPPVHCGDQGRPKQTERLETASFQLFHRSLHLLRFLQMLKSSMHYCVSNEASDIARSQEVVFPQVGSTRDDRSKWPVIKESHGASAEAKGSQQRLGLKDVTKPEGIAGLARQRWREWISKDTTKFPEVVTMFL